jgi:hypothetical protein
MYSSKDRSQTFRIGGPAHIHDMDESIRMAQVVQKLVTQSASLMRSWNQTSHVQEFDGDGTAAFHATAVVRLAFIRHVEALASAFYLKIPDCSLRINGCEAELGRSD